MASLGTLTADLVLQIAQWSGPLDKAEQDLVKFHSQVQKTVNDITHELTTFAAESIVGFTSLVGALGEIKTAFADSMQWGKSLELLARSTGEPVEKLDALALSAKLSDVSIDELSGTLNKLSKSMVAARDPTSQMADIFKALHVDPGTAENVRSTVDVMLDTVKALSTIQDPALRAATAMALFGKGGADMAAKLAGIAEESERAQAAIDAFGKTSDAQAAAAKSLGDDFELIGQAAMRLAGPIIEALAPVFDAIEKALEALVGESSGASHVIGEVLAGALRVAAIAFVALGVGMQTVLIITKGVAEAVSALLTGQIMKVGPIVNNTLKSLGEVAAGAAGAFGALLAPATEKAAAGAKGLNADAGALSNTLAKTGDETKKAADALDALATKYNDAYAADAAGVAPQTIKTLRDLDTLLDAHKIKWDVYVQGIQDALDKDPVLAAEQKALTAAMAEYDKVLQDVYQNYEKTIKSIGATVAGIDDENKALQDQIDVMGLTGAARDDAIAQKKIQAALDASLAKLADATFGNPDLYDRVSARLKAYVADLSKTRTQLIQTADAQKQFTDALNAATSTNTSLETEVKLLGSVGVARDQQIAQMDRARLMSLALTDADKQNVITTMNMRDALLAQKAAYEENQKSIEAWASVFKTVDDYGKSLFESMAKGLAGVKDWAKQAGDSLKKYLLDTLYELTVKKFVVNIVQNVATSLGASAANVAAGAAQGNSGSILGTLGTLFGGGGGGSSMLGTVASGIGALFGGGTAAAAAGSTAAVVGMGGGTASLFGGAAAGASALATEMATTTATTAALGAGAATATVGLASMIPVVGAFIAVGYLAYTLLSQAKGGPKSGGYAVGGNVAAGSPASRFFSPNDRDADVQKLTTGISDAFTQALTNLGGTGNAAFALGFDTDPEGKAGSRVSSAAYVGGRAVYATHDVDVGRDDAAVQAAMQTETERLLLAALQASDLPESMARILNTVAAATASATDVTNVIALAGAFKQVSDLAAAMVNPMDAAAQSLNNANTTALQAYETQRDAFNKLAAATPPTAEGLLNLANASADLYKSTVQLLAGMVQLKQQVSGMFSDTRETIERATLDPQQLYERIRQQTQGLYTQLQGATDPTDINRLTGQINENINQAFGMLTPEQQRAEQAQFLQQLDNVAALAQQRIDASIATVEGQASTDQATLTDTLNKILDSITGAADDFKEGAQDVSKAATAGFTVSVRVTDDRATAEVTG